MFKAPKKEHKTCLKKIELGSKERIELLRQQQKKYNELMFSVSYDLFVIQKRSINSNIQWDLVRRNLETKPEYWEYLENEDYVHTKKQRYNRVRKYWYNHLDVKTERRVKCLKTGQIIECLLSEMFKNEQDAPDLVPYNVLLQMKENHRCLRSGGGAMFEALLKSEFGRHISDNPFEQDREVWQTSSALAMYDEEILPCCSSELQLSSALDMSDGDADAFAESLWYDV